MLGGFWCYAASARGEAWWALLRESVACGVAALRARQARALPRFGRGLGPGDGARLAPARRRRARDRHAERSTPTAPDCTTSPVRRSGAPGLLRGVRGRAEGPAALHAGDGGAGRKGRRRRARARRSCSGEGTRARARRGDGRSGSGRRRAGGRRRCRADFRMVGEDVRRPGSPDALHVGALGRGGARAGRGPSHVRVRGHAGAQGDAGSARAPATTAANMASGNL